MGASLEWKQLCIFKKALLLVAAWAPGVLQCSVELGLQDYCNVLLLIASMASLFNAFLIGTAYATCTHAHAITVGSWVLKWGWWWLASRFVWVLTVIGWDHACGSLFVSC